MRRPWLRVQINFTCPLYLVTQEMSETRLMPNEHRIDFTSSLKTRYLDLNMSRYRKALSVEKSSNCTKSWGNTSFTESTNSCIKASIWSKLSLAWKQKLQIRKHIPLVCLDACGVHQSTGSHQEVSGCLYLGQDRLALYSLVWYQHLWCTGLYKGYDNGKLSSEKAQRSDLQLANSNRQPIDPKVTVAKNTRAWCRVKNDMSVIEGKTNHQSLQRF